MKIHLVIAVIDGVQVFRLVLGLSLEDVEIRARYLWKDNNLQNIEVQPLIELTLPPPS